MHNSFDLTIETQQDISYTTKKFKDTIRAYFTTPLTSLLFLFSLLTTSYFL
jgi:hypothetical protein